MALRGSTDLDITMASGNSRDHSHQYDTSNIMSSDSGLDQKLVVSWAKDINLAPDWCKTMGIHKNLGLQKGLGQQTLDSRGNTDHRGLSRWSNPENDHFFILDILLLLRTGCSCNLAACEVAEMECKLQAAIYHSVGPTEQGHVLSIQVSLTPTTAVECLVLPLSTALYHSFPLFFHLSIEYSFITVAMVLLLFAKTTLLGNILCNNSLARFKASHF